MTVRAKTPLEQAVRRAARLPAADRRRLAASARTKFVPDRYAMDSRSALPPIGARRMRHCAPRERAPPLSPKKGEGPQVANSEQFRPPGPADRHWNFKVRQSVCE